MVKRSSTVGLCTAVLSGLVALAGPAQADDAATAQSLFLEGRAALEKGDYAAACPKFEASAALVRRPSTLLNLAQCAEQGGRPLAARKLWQDGIQGLEPGDPRRSVSEERLAQLEPRIPRLTVKSPNDLTKEAVALLDGRLLSAADLGVETLLEVGEHTLLLRGPGQPEQKLTLRLEEGERREVVLSFASLDATSLTPAPVREPTRPPPETGSEPPRATGPADAANEPPANGPDRTLAYVSLGVGAVGLVAAGVTGVLVLDKKSTVEAACPEKACSSQEGYDAAESGQSLLLVNTVAWGVGVLGLGLGTVLFLTAEPAPTRTAKVAPYVGPTGAGLVAAGSF
jgi:hypothetical protein